MIRVYIKSYIGEFKDLAEADAYLHKSGYERSFDEETQPVFEEVEEEV